MHSPSLDTGHDKPNRLVLLLPLLFVVSGTLIRFLAFRYAQPDTAWMQYFDALCRWDCGWYVHMAESGYDTFPVPSRVSAGNWAFFPFYPILVGLIGKVIPLPTIVLASLVSIFTAYAAVVVAWPLLGRNIRAYALYAAFILSGPLSFYFTTFFTEVMFVLLTTLVFRFIGRSDYLGAAGAAALLSATRIVGVFASLAIGIKALMDYRASRGTWRGVIGGLLSRPQLVLAIFISPLGFFVYVAFLNYWIGDGLAFSHTQRAWGRMIDNPFTYLWEGLVNWPDNGALLSNSQILALAAVTGLVCTVILAIRRQWPAVVFCLFCILIPLAAGLASMLRFMAGMVPVTVTLATLLGRNRAVFAISLLGLIVSAWFVTLAWLGGNVALV
jgi:hypothetical protein